MKRILLLLVACNHATSLPGSEQAPICVKDVQTAEQLTCALKQDGSVWCWGALYYGDSDSDILTYAAPTRVDGLPPVVELANAGTHVCARTDGGDVWCWGENGHGELAQPQTLKGSIAPLLAFRQVDTVYTGDYVTCVARAEKLECSGITPSAPYGGGVYERWTYTPVAVPQLSPAVALGLGLSWACALGPDGALRCWGDNWGTLGDGTMNVHPAPVMVTTLDHEVAQISAAGDHNCALRADGSVWCWGVTGGLDGPTLLPTRVSAVSDAVSVSAGMGASCAVEKDGAVVCWPKDADPATVPVERAHLPRPALKVSATDRRACALLDAERSEAGIDGGVWCWSTVPGNPEPGTLAAPARVPLDCP